MIADDSIMRELYMLTGQVNKDKNYLYYLLIKDGSYFNEEPKQPEAIKTDSTVDAFDDWFNGL